MNKRIISLLLSLVMILGLVLSPGITANAWAGTMGSLNGNDVTEASVGNPFTDVPEDSFYCVPVLWALEKGITTGATATTFNPNGVCQRAAVVTFLWRAAGKPETTTADNPFVDVKETDFFYKAVLWAVEKGITNGSDASHFDPYGVCNRAQVVTFLHRAKGSPAPANGDLPFTDVPAGVWYAAPVAWAVENGITNGLSATEFGPGAACNRAQVVTFLYRAYSVKEPVCAHGDLQAFEAKVPTCMEPGNLAYWYCADCEKYFSDADAAAEITYEDTILAATGHVPGAEATCTEDQVCTVCGEVIATMNGHIPGAEATCTEPQRCVVCKTVLAEATGHSLTYVEAKEPTCTEPGNIAYYSCTKCGECFRDGEGTEQIESAQTILPACHRNVTAVPEKEPTYEESGNWAYWYCSDCGSYFSDEACRNKITYNDTVRPAKETFTITYYLYDYNEYLEEQGVENPNQNWYDPEEGLVLENLTKPGFRFDGWYDAEGASGQLVREIKAGERGNKKLYARWSLITYTISYKDDIYKVNYGEDTYEVDKRKILLYPEQMGYEFVGWEDQYGNVYTEVPRGTTGRLELTAKWKDYLYNAYVHDDQKTVAPFYYDENLRTYYFVYNLGELEGILLEDLRIGGNVFRHTGGTDTEFSWTETVTIEESRSKTIGTTISKSVSTSESWEEQETNAKENSNETSVDVTIGMELGPEPIKFKLEGTLGSSTSTTTSYAITEVEGGSTGTEEGESHDSSVTLSYLEQMSVERGTNISIPGDKPAGYYCYTKLGNAKVYGIVAFNCLTGNYSLTTYSILEYSYPAHLYFHSKESMEQSVQNPDVEPIPFDVPVNQIANYIEQHWYVNYNGNGGSYSYTISDETIESGKPITVNGMPVSEFVSGSSGALALNLYTKTGYTFAGWALSPDGEVVYKDQEVISVQKTERADVLSLYAVWEKNPYTIEYVASKPGHASADVQNMPENTDCRYDTAFTLGDAPTLTGWIFHGWYRDPGCTDYVGAPGALVENVNLTSEHGAEIPLYGRWEAEKRTITYQANDGSGRTKTVKVDYDSTYTPEGNPFDRQGYAFVGWSLDPVKPLEPDESLESILPHQGYLIQQDYTLYAVWAPVVAGWNNGRSDENNVAVRNEGLIDYWQTGLNREALKKADYTKVSISGTIRGQRIYDWWAKDWYIEFYDRAGNKVHEDAIGKFNYGGFETRNIQYTLDIDCIRDDGTIMVRFDHEGGDDERGQYRIGLIQITSTALSG